MKKKLISAVLALVIVLGLLPMAAMADAETTSGEEQVTITLRNGSAGGSIIKTITITKGGVIPCEELLNLDWESDAGQIIAQWVCTQIEPKGIIYAGVTTFDKDVEILGLPQSKDKVSKIIFQGESARTFYLYKDSSKQSTNEEIWKKYYPTPSEGKKWVENGQDFGGTMPTDNQDHVYTVVAENASGEEHEVTEVSVTEGGQTSTHGTVAVSPTESVAGGKVTITISPDSGYMTKDVAVISWTEDFNIVPTDVQKVKDNEYSFFMPDCDVEVLVSLEVDEGENPPAPPATEYTITVTDTENGSVSTSTQKATEGTEVTVTATPNEGYELDGITVTGASVTVTSGKFTMPAANITVTATFKKSAEEPVKPEPEQAMYEYKHRQGLFMGQLVLSGLTPNSKYVCQMAKTGATDAVGCAIVIVETGADETTQTIEVLGNTDGYTVQLWKYPESGEVSSVGALTSVTLTKK